MLSRILIQTEGDLGSPGSSCTPSLCSMLVYPLSGDGATSPGAASWLGTSWGFVPEQEVLSGLSVALEFRKSLFPSVALAQLTPHLADLVWGGLHPG